MARVSSMGKPYSGVSPTAGLGGGTRSRGGSLAGAFKLKRPPNIGRKAKVFETLAAGYRKMPKAF
jgi:hypothetical protein